MDVSDKDRLRQAMLQQRAALPTSFQASAAEAIAARLLAREEFRERRDVGLYWAFRGEVPTREMFRRLIEAGHRLYLPRLGASGLEFAGVKDEASLSPAGYGLLEPGPECETVQLESLAVLILPGVAFDLRGGRLGWGKGYYDRVLRGFRGRRLALAYEFQVFEKIPTDDWDEGIEVILTEQRSIDAGMA